MGKYGILRLNEDKLRLLYSAVYDKRGDILFQMRHCDEEEKKKLRKDEHGLAYIAKKITKTLFDLTMNC